VQSQVPKPDHYLPLMNSFGSHYVLRSVLHGGDACRLT
jgi:hypothetical protein